MLKRMMFLIMTLCSVYFIHSQSLSFNFNTGDAEMDLSLNNINVQAKAAISEFAFELSEAYPITLSEVFHYINNEKMQPAEVYFVCEVAVVASVPVLYVIKIWKDQNQSCGKIAKAMGIKPGSAEFKALKAKTSERAKTKIVGKKKNKKK